ncbi:hypothetical protein A4A49_52597 [Nicotiana attenuata]|uniref:Uncharacterized protein n=1 Tax=Nicotiana attenuata TaxID=49451 RepID=A0A1J6IL87_NICAT|nr:hypothetical protein A4A49_52597 [Nicotiana attenuata]
MEETIKTKEDEYETDDSDLNTMALHKAQADYIRVKWAEEGDNNSKYFYTINKGRRRRAHILRIKDSRDNWMVDSNNIAQAAIDHFCNLFSQPDVSSDMSILR